ncbi:Unannotated [Lentimonas sp. CC19]|nr:Unannotated [Lentimonas sp. CC4]CAA6687195.1 Unannotated [Lentimonas sp. CC6]CAA6691631.1 Unannotated [Lentimonas sp. CC10]CAA6696288.1 Unannotated [Lentimonas sp. CC19]CAA7070837.1 Unannotated [Lentimonas sp. CC11]CAA7170224.1 Unannotated [Lentimonas sp. CC21]CAA7182519.1 Unannotated [Lentimonas sp. CC8]
MAIGLQTLTTLVVVHLETTFLFKVTHGNIYTVLIEKSSKEPNKCDGVKRFLTFLELHLRRLPLGKRQLHPLQHDSKMPRQLCTKQNLASSRG